MEKNNKKQTQQLYCVSTDGDDFDIPKRLAGPNTNEMAISTEINDILEMTEEEDWDIDDKLVVYKLVPVGYIKKGRRTFNKVDE